MQFFPNLLAKRLSNVCHTGGQGIPPPSHIGGYKLYKRLFFLLGLPIIGLVTAFNVYQKKQQDECDRPPFVKYEYLRKRDKRFPWGDGDKTLFHNPMKNPLADGYEDELEEGED
ncbi:cytochrome c oxidase subunit 6A1, mitochondrial-like [Diabrotica virgifera virgifera]|uniref:Cytochrome c oxidase polypeptide VIa n=1 Tax=Diabrotica virgifera virgifera TaxID=50390 RepID=A0ABM5K3N3_DIAVI|nr:cytochrome c oxidase subunit 6A1, mitochondrial-like [Diabrotica virgifera virgifera]